MHLFLKKLQNKVKKFSNKSEEKLLAYQQFSDHPDVADGLWYHHSQRLFLFRVTAFLST